MVKLLTREMLKGTGTYGKVEMPTWGKRDNYDDLKKDTLKIMNGIKGINKGVPQK